MNEIMENEMINVEDMIYEEGDELIFWETKVRESEEKASYNEKRINELYVKFGLKKEDIYESR